MHQKTIALVAHDNRKKDLIEWVSWNHSLLAEHKLVCTGTTGRLVEEALAQKAEEVKERPVYPVDLLGSIYQLAGIDASAKLPHPMGQEAHVVPSAAEGVKSGGLLTEIM